MSQLSNTDPVVCIIWYYKNFVTQIQNNFSYTSKLLLCNIVFWFDIQYICKYLKTVYWFENYLTQSALDSDEMENIVTKIALNMLNKASSVVNIWVEVLHLLCFIHPSYVYLWSCNRSIYFSLDLPYNIVYHSLLHFTVFIL